MEKEIDFMTGVVYAFGATHTYTLPKVPNQNIKGITIIASMGAISGGSTGSYIASTALQVIKVRVNGKECIVWDGTKNIAGQISMGIASLREFYLQMHLVAMPDNFYILEFPTALPFNSDIQVILETASSITAIQTAGGDRTTLASSTIKIKYKIETNNPVKVVVPFINWTLYSHGARTGYLPEFVPPTTLPVRKLMMISYDGTTISSTTYDSLQIYEGSELKGEGSIAEIRGIQQGKSGVAQSTGHFHVGFVSGIKVLPNSLKLNFYAGTAGTAKYVHLAWVAY